MGREISIVGGVLGVALGVGCDRIGVDTPNMAVVIAVRVISDRAENFLMTQIYWL